MILTIIDATLDWTSPDKKISIWKVKDSDGQEWQTMSKRIADAAESHMAVDVTTRVSDKGKTYLIQVPKDVPENVQVPQAQLPGQTNASMDEAIERFSAAVDHFSAMVDKLSDQLSPEGLDDLQTLMDKDEGPELPPARVYEDQIGRDIDDLT